MLNQTLKEAFMKSVLRVSFLLVFLLALPVLAQDIGTGDALFDEGDYAGAAAAYQQAFDADGDGVALYKLANAKVYEAGALEGEGAEARYDQAVAAAKEAVELVPDDLEAHMALVRAWGRLAEYRGVLESLNLATLMKEEMDLILERDPNHHGTLHALALWHLNVPWIFGGRQEKVRGLFDQAIAVQPTVLHHLEYGESLITLGDLPAAKAQLEAALALPTPTAADQDEQARAQALLDSTF
jgi:tetratricopeptide (TPR) repeat protein